MTISTEAKIKKREQSWAVEHGIAFNAKGYVYKLEDNLFEPLEEDARTEFASGKGGELKGKMLALHSSSALVCNFFHYWRYRNVPAVAMSCGLSPNYYKLRFEKAYPKPQGVGGELPHVDIEFTSRTVTPVAIEAKFTEQYYRKRKLLNNKYVETAGIWGSYAGCESLANLIVEGKEVFEYLDAPQLLKHILGLKTEYGEQGFELLYLWYKVDSDEAVQHQREIKRFESFIGSDLSFCTRNYQEVFQVLKSHSGVHSRYMNYMEERYF